MTNITTNNNNVAQAQFNAEIIEQIYGEICAIEKFDEVQSPSEIWSAQQNLCARHNDYIFDNDVVSMDRILDLVRNVSTCEELLRNLLSAGMSEYEGQMVLAVIYDNCFFSSIGDSSAPMWVELRFKEYEHGTKVVYLNWSTGQFNAQLPPTCGD